MRVRGHEGQAVVVDVDEPPGEGELLTMRVGGICASDFAYLERGTNFSVSICPPGTIET
jgi:hypothetical protein